MSSQVTPTIPAEFDQLSNGTKDSIITDLWESTMDELISEVACEVHREIKLGTWSRAPISSDFKCICPLEEQTGIEETHDILGHKLGVPINQTFPCVHCGRSVVATRYAPHLEKCMGFGRNSSRIANQKLANYKDQNIELPTKRSIQDMLSDEEEYEEDPYDDPFY